MKLVRISKPDIGNWDVGQEVGLPDAVAAEYVKEGIGEIIPKRTKPEQAPPMTMQELTEKVAEKAAGSK